MFAPVELFVGLRHLRARYSNRFVSFITVASMIGVALGVAALIVVLSVMNGFENELRKRLLSLASHATVTGVDGTVDDWPALVETTKQYPGVAGAAPYVEFEGMLSRGAEMTPALIRGIEPGLEATVSTIGEHMIEGRLDDVDAGQGGIVLGRILALKLGVGAGDTLIVMVPRGIGGGLVEPRLRQFTVSGVFEVGLQDHDNVLALIGLERAAAVAGLGEAVSGVRLRFDDIFAAPIISKDLVAELPGDYQRSDWTIENAAYFRAISIEKTMMALILMLIVAVAAFNIVASLVMVVTEKRTEIAILRTLGLSPRGIVGVFMIQGTVIGWLGTLLGVIGGVVLGIHVETVAPWLEQLLGFEFMASDVYYITELPSDIRPWDVVRIALIALALTAVSTVYPARRAAQTEPAVALRYE